MDAVIVDLSQTGLEMWLKPHQVELMRVVWAAEGPIDSRTAWRRSLELVEDYQMRSRATAINFLKDAAARGWLEMVQEGSKGGEKFLYVPSKDYPCEISFTQELAMRAVESMGDLLGVTFIVKQRPVKEVNQ